MAASGKSDEANIEADVVELVNQEKALEARATDLAEKFPQFAEFLQEQKRFAEQSALFWDTIKNEMIANNIKSIKGDWGSVTIGERTNYKAIDPELEGVPRKFIKKVLDTTGVGNHAKLTGKLPAGIESTSTQYLLRRIK